MKKLLIGLGLVVAALTASAQVAVSVGGRLAPGVYGSVNIGDYGRPAVVYTQPQVIVRDYSYVEEPVYIYVPTWQQRNWGRYCYQYQSCNRPVYFVQETWVREQYTRQQNDRNYRQRREYIDGQWRDRDEWQEHRGHEGHHDNGRHEGHGRGHNGRD